MIFPLLGSQAGQPARGCPRPLPHRRHSAHQPPRPLHLSYNSLRAVPSPALGLTAQLRELSLAYNPLGRLEDAAFLGLGELTRLDLTGCSLSQIPYRTFASLHSLEQLYLRCSFLRKFVVALLDFCGGNAVLGLNPASAIQ